MMTFDAAAFGPITLDHLPPFAQRLREAANLVWEEGYRQPFLRELGNGTLDRERFAFYLLQDYRYLNDYAKVHALALTKTQDPEVMRFMADVQNGIFNVESAMHRKYMASYGISEQEMNSVRQSAFARAYTSNILSIAYGNPLVDVLVAVLPCAWVYADYGQRLAAEHIEQLTEHLSAERKDELVDIFVTGVQNEYMFWSSAYDMQYTWKPEWDV